MVVVGIEIQASDLSLLYVLQFWYFMVCGSTSAVLVFYVLRIHNMQYMKKFLISHWLRAVQFFRNTLPKNEMQCKKKKYSANFLIFKLF